MHCRFSWIDSPLPIDVIGHDLWCLYSQTTREGVILGLKEDCTDEHKEQYLSDLKKSLAGDNTHLLIGCAERQLILTCLMRQKPFATSRHIGELQKGIVAPRYQDRTLLAQALEQVAERACELGISKLILDAREDSEAFALWREWGFKSFGVMEDYARYHGQSYRGHYMEQSLAELVWRLQNRKAVRTEEVLYSKEG